MAGGGEAEGVVPPPIGRFLRCGSGEELRVGEVGKLLEDYKRLAGLLTELGVFE
jgi:hypothetical protein